MVAGCKVGEAGEERRWEHRVSLESGDSGGRKAENSYQRRSLIRKLKKQYS